MKLFKVQLEKTDKGYKPTSVEEIQECFYCASSCGREFESVYVRIFRAGGEFKAEFRKEDSQYLSRYSKALKKDVPSSCLETFLEDMEGGSPEPRYVENCDCMLAESQKELLNNW